MAISLPLHEMSQSDKLAMMEALWSDLSRDADSFESPAWHEAVLLEREQHLAQAESSFIDWEAAKAEIRRRIA